MSFAAPVINIGIGGSVCRGRGCQEPTMKQTIWRLFAIFPDTGDSPVVIHILAFERIAFQPGISFGKEGIIHNGVMMVNDHVWLVFIGLPPSYKHLMRV